MCKHLDLRQTESESNNGTRLPRIEIVMKIVPVSSWSLICNVLIQPVWTKFMFWPQHSFSQYEQFCWISLKETQNKTRESNVQESNVQWMKIYRVYNKVVKSVPFKKPAQNGVVFVSVLIPARSGNSGQIPAVPFRFRSGRSVPALKSSFFFFFFLNLWFFFF